MGAHVGKAFRGNFPVAAKRVSPIGVIRLPAVVDNDSVQSELLRQRALLLQFMIEKILMVAVPGGVDRFKGRVRRPGRLVFREGGKPLGNRTDRIGVKDAPAVDPQSHLITADRCFGTHEKREFPLDPVRLLVDSARKLDKPFCFGNGQCQPVLSFQIQKGLHGNVGCQLRTLLAAPVGRKIAAEDAARGPACLHVNLRNAPEKTHLRRRKLLIRLHLNADLFQIRFQNRSRVRQLPARKIALEPDFSENGWNDHDFKSFSFRLK